MTEIRNILIIGRTGSGKSTLANVLTNTNKFKESEHAVSETKDSKSEIFEEDGIKYRVIDTIGIGDAELSVSEVLHRIADAAYAVRNGLSQILFVTSGRFTEEEIFAYNLLRRVIFDENITSYTTIIRTKFWNFRNPQRCLEDKKSMIKESKELAEIISSCKKVIHVNNPPVDVDDEDELMISKRARANSRTFLLTYLRTCQENYRPESLDEINNRLNERVMTKSIQTTARENERLQRKTTDLENRLRNLQLEAKQEQTELQNGVYLDRPCVIS